MRERTKSETKRKQKQETEAHIHNLMQLEIQSILKEYIHQKDKMYAD